MGYKKEISDLVKIAESQTASNEELDAAAARLAEIVTDKSAPEGARLSAATENLRLVFGDLPDAQ